MFQLLMCAQAFGLPTNSAEEANNLAYLYLERAKRSKDRSHKATDSKIAIQRLEAAQADLESAKEYCAKAIETDRTYAFAYDNLGNVWFELACLNFEDPARAVADFQEAEDSFRKATAFKSDYGAALNDRAKLHLKRVQCEIENSFWAPLGPKSELERAMDAHLACLGTVTSSDAIEFRCDQQFAKWLKPLYKKRWVQELVSLKLGSPETKCHCLANSQAQDFGS